MANNETNDLRLAQVFATKEDTLGEYVNGTIFGRTFGI